MIKNKGSASMTMVIAAAAVSGVVALGVTRVMSMQFNAVASTGDKLKAQHDALNRAEILRASTYDSIIASSEELSDGLFEEVSVKEERESGILVKVATIQIYKDKTKKEKIATMVVKRTNPTISLVDEYKPEGAKDSAYNVSVINKHFAYIDKSKNNGTIGSSIKPVYVEAGAVKETDFSKATSSDSEKIAVLNPDGSFGYTTKDEFLNNNGVSRATVGLLDVSTGTVTRKTGAFLKPEPYVGQILILEGKTPENSIGFAFGNTTFTIKLKDAANNEGRPYGIKAAYGISNEYYLPKNINIQQTYAPWVMIFDGENWLLIGTFLNSSGYGYSG